MYPLRVVFVLAYLLVATGLPGGVGRASAGSPSAPQAPIAPPAVVPGQLLVGFAGGVDEATRATIIARHGGRAVGWLGGIDTAVVALPPERPLGLAARDFAAEAGVRHAEPNYRFRAASVPDDPDYGGAGLWGLDAIEAPAAWATTTGSDEVIVGIVDTGIDYDHPDLAANIWRAPAGWDLRGCGPGTPGFRAIGGAIGCDPRDDHGNGTLVAGTIGAVGNNGIGVVGVNWRVRLMALKALDQGGFGRSSDAAAVIDYAIAARGAGQNVRVLNFGWVDTNRSQALRDAIDRAAAAGILVVAAAGDRGLDLDQTPHYPASFATEPDPAANVLAVTTLNNRNRVELPANIGRTSVHLGAPGVDVRSTRLGGGYLAYRSTGAAAAHVSGAAALVLAAAGPATLGVADLRARLLYCGAPTELLDQFTTTGRRLNVARAVANADCAAPAAYRLAVTTTLPAAGTVVAAPPGPSYPPGAIVTLSAQPAEGFTFDGWRLESGAIVAGETLAVTMGTDRAIVAIFEARRFTLALGATPGGRATAPGGPSYLWGTAVALVATPDQGYLFTGWLVDGVAVGSDNPLSLPIYADHTVRATFTPDPTPGATVALDLSATAGGAVSALPAGERHAAGARVSLLATPDEGQVFTGWTIDGAPGGIANPYTLTLATNRTVVATFAPGRALTLSATSGGAVAFKAAGWSGGSPYPDGTALTLTATTGTNAVFTGWTIDGIFAGWSPQLTLTMAAPHTVVANFAPRPRFTDLAPGPPPYEAIAQLAARGIIRGYADGAFGAADTTLRAQMATLIARAMSWEAEDHAAPFTDRCDPANPANCVDDGLWRAIGTLAFYDVARGYDDGSFGSLDTVLQVQTIAFITRAMIVKGYWAAQPDDPGLYPHIPAASGHRLDIATYVHYAGLPPDTTSAAAWPTWDRPAARGWFAEALWRALDGHFGQDRAR